MELLGEIKPAFVPEVNVDQCDMGSQRLHHAQCPGTISGYPQHLDTLSPKKYGGGGTEMSIVVDDDALQPLSS